MVRLWVARGLAGIVALAVGGVVLTWTAAAVEALSPGWQAAVSMPVASLAVALVWTLLADGPQATVALVRRPRDRR